MELQELSKLWNQYDQKLNVVLEVNKKLLKENAFNKVSSLLRGFKFETQVELLFDILLVIVFVNILFRNLDSLGILRTSLILLCLSVFSAIWNGYKLNQLNKIEYGDSVIDSQKRLARLKYYAGLETKCLYFLIPLFSMGFIPFLFYSLLGVDIFTPLAEWWWSLGIGSLLIAVIIVWFIRKFPDKKMQSALEFLNEIKKYES